MKQNSTIISITLCALLFASAALSQTAPHFSDTSAVLLQVELLKQGILMSRAEEVRGALANDMIIGGQYFDSVGTIALVDSVLASASLRMAARVSGIPEEFGPFWDFSLDDVGVFFDGDSCVVTCNLRLYAAQTKDGCISSVADTFVVRRTGCSWMIDRVQHLFTFLGSGGGQ